MLTTVQAAARKGVSRQAIHLAIMDGRLKATREPTVVHWLTRRAVRDRWGRRIPKGTELPGEMTLWEASRLTGVSYPVIYRAVLSGRVPSIKKEGRTRYRISESDLEKWDPAHSVD